MRHLHWTLLTLWLLYRPMLGQANPSTALHDALALENRGNFDSAAKVAKAAIDSRQLSGNELGRGYIILAVAWRGAGDLTDAQIAFEDALQVLEHDREHPEDYASALENYAGFYSELEQLDLAAPMYRKAFHLRQRIGDHTGTALSLTRLAELALARNRVREAHRYLQKASDEAKLASDLIDDDKAFFFETQGYLAIAEHHPPAAVAAYQRALKLVERSRGEQHWLAGWEHMLLGKAYAESGDFRSALADMQTGLTTLDHALGQKNPKYFAAELAYSRVLDQVGSHAEAAQVRAAAEKASKGYYGSQCAGCTINVAAFR
ncbi:MAG TPA: tetratricopeptide repeat protein [Terriglobales bacterium]|nr:tetratricopeptide repeat protein [Terriglobales bacterium]